MTGLDVQAPSSDEEKLGRLLDGVPMDGAQAAFVSGSVAEGWASQGSNYNVYVIGDVPEGLQPTGGFAVPPDGQRVPAHHYVVGDDTRVVIRYWRPEDVEWAAAAVRYHELRPTMEIWPTAIQFLHRLRIGIPLYGHERFEELRSMIDGGMLARYLTQHRAMIAESYCTDSVTRRAAGRPYDALLQARLAFDYSVDAYLASLGDTNPQEKWRHKRVLKFAGESRLRRDYETAIRGPGDGELDPHIRMLLHRSETLNCCIQLSCGYDALVLSTEDTSTGTGSTGDTDPDHDGARVERVLGSRLSRRYTGQAVALRLDGQAVDLSPIAALVYGCADGRWTTVQIARHAAGYLDRPYEEVTADVHEVVRELAVRDFVELG
jgi:hypothetical protein